MADGEERQETLPAATLVAIPEVLMLFDDYISRNKHLDSEYQPNPLLAQAREYAHHVASSTAGNKETVQKMREVLMMQHSFTAVEAVAVINLSIGSADEARRLVPTLNLDRFSDEELERILAEVATYRDLA